MSISSSSGASSTSDDSDADLKVIGSTAATRYPRDWRRRSRDSIRRRTRRYRVKLQRRRHCMSRCMQLITALQGLHFAHDFSVALEQLRRFVARIDVIIRAISVEPRAPPPAGSEDEIVNVCDDEADEEGGGFENMSMALMPPVRPTPNYRRTQRKRNSYKKKRGVKAAKGKANKAVPFFNKRAPVVGAKGALVKTPVSRSGTPKYMKIMPSFKVRSMKSFNRKVCIFL